MLTSRVIWKWVTGNDPLAEIDHRDVNPSNDAFANLREATHSQNHMNRPGWGTGFKGACFDQRRGRWRAQISAYNRRRHLGYFDTEADAHAAYVRAATALHGEFANTVSQSSCVTVRCDRVHHCSAAWIVALLIDAVFAALLPTAASNQCAVSRSNPDTMQVRLNGA